MPNKISLTSLKAALDSVPEMVAIKSIDGKYLYVNERVNTFYKSRFDSIINKTIEDIYPEKEASYIRSLDERVLKTKKGFTEEISVLTDDGYIFTEISRFPVFGENNEIEFIISLGINITERKKVQLQLDEKIKELEELNEKYKKLSYNDVLTGIYNRRKLYEDLQGLEHTGFYTLILLDLNNFKLVNDQFGHSKGDDVLVGFSSYLQELINDQEGHAYRIGGDEFVVLLSGANFNFEPYIKKLDIYLQQVHKDVSVSFGATNIDSVHKMNEVHRNLIISRADTLLYKYKNEVKNKD